MFSNNLFTKVTLSIAVIVLNQTQVNAQNFLDQLKQYNPNTNQNRTIPPDIIIDSNPNNGNTNPQPYPQTPPPNQPTTNNASNPRFTCEFVNGQYTVMYNPENQINQKYAWAIPGNLGGGWTPQRRCLEISNRLENYRPDGLIDLNMSRQNNYNILCVTTEVDPNCRIVLTVPPNQNPEVVRNLVFENLLTADSGIQTTGVNTYNGNNYSIGNILNPNGRNKKVKSIHLKPFLSTSDGGTATRLKKK